MKKNNIMKIKYIWLLLILLGFIACNDEEDVLADNNIETEVFPELTAGSVDFSKFVSIGNSLTAGYTDNALFIAGQENSLPNILSQKFALAGGGSFTQPMMSDNLGGLLAGGTRIADPRYVFNGSGPAPLESVIGPVSPSTDIVLNNPTGPFNNMGVPGAKSFHLLYDGYGSLANLGVTANPYFIRMASAPNATVLGDAMAQSPSFFSLWIGNNDVLGYALVGGDVTEDQITPSAGPPGVGFDQTYGALIATLTSGGAEGVVANIPYVTTIPHFTTVPHNPLDPSNPDFGPQIPTLNATFALLNQAFAALGVPERSVVFSETEASAMLIHDESLADISAGLFQVLQLGGLDAQTAGLFANHFKQCRQANEDDLFVLSSSSVIATVNVDYYTYLVTNGVPASTAGQLSVNGVTFPLADKWALIPSEQMEIKEATDAFNATIQATAAQAGLAFVDANMLMQQLAGGGFASGDYVLTADLVTGGAFSLDGIHPTARGYALLANEFMKAIDATYGSNFEASGNFTNVADYPTNYSPLLQ